MWATLIIVAAAVYLLYCTGRYFYLRPRAPHQIIPALKKQGVNLIYNGETSEQVFTSSRYKIRAKPDFIYERADGSLILVEYKSSRRRAMKSDITQLIATAIAVKSHHKNKRVTTGYVLTGKNYYKWVDLSKSLDLLALEIERPLSVARQVKNGYQPSADPVKKKCLACGYQYVCEHSEA